MTLKNGGREHWTDVYTICMTGAGIEGDHMLGIEIPHPNCATAPSRMKAACGERPLDPGSVVETVVPPSAIGLARAIHARGSYARAFEACARVIQRLGSAQHEIAVEPYRGRHP